MNRLIGDFTAANAFAISRIRDALLQQRHSAVVRIAGLSNALHDDLGDNRFIVTVPDCGYAFVPLVTQSHRSAVSEGERNEKAVPSVWSVPAAATGHLIG